MVQMIKLSESDAGWLNTLARECYLSAYIGMLTDAEIARRFETEYTEPSFRNHLRDPENHFFGVKSSEGWVGYLHLRSASEPGASPRTLRLSRIYISTAERAKGAGREVMRFVETFAHEHGFKVIRLNCYEGNPRALAFYAREGYAQVGLSPFRITDIDRRDAVLEKRL